MKKAERYERLKELLNILLYCGEVPYRALRVLGSSPNYMHKAFHRLEKKLIVKKVTKLNQMVIVFENNNLAYNLVDYSSLLFPGALSHYRKIYNEEISGRERDTKRTHRNLRLGEICAIMKQSNIPLYPDEKPQIDQQRLKRDTVAFYTTKEIKSAMASNVRSQTFATRSLGVLIKSQVMYMVYMITRKTIKVTEYTEGTSKDYFEYTINGKIEDDKSVQPLHLDEALIFTYDYKGALVSLVKTWRESKESYFNIDTTFKESRMLPYNKIGARYVDLFLASGMHKWFVDIMIERNYILEAPISFECDGIVEGTYTLIWFDCRLKRLKSFLAGARIRNTERFRIVCFDFQIEGLEALISKNVSLSWYSYEEIEQHFKEEYQGIKRAEA